MKNVKLFFVAMMFSTANFAQNVGINSTGASPNASAMLDIVSTNKGFLMPRVALTGTTDITTVTAAANWLTVFNTATVSDVTPGMYYWDGTKWVRIMSSNNAWNTLGNWNTVEGTNFLGTLDAINLRFRTNNVERFEMNQSGQLLSIGLGTVSLPTYSFQNDPDIGMWSPGANTLAFSTGATERMRILSTGEVIIGATATLYAVDLFSAVGNATLPYAVNGYSNQNGAGVYGEITGGTTSEYGTVGIYQGSGTGGGTSGLNLTTSASTSTVGTLGGWAGTAATGGYGLRGINYATSGSGRIGVLGSYNAGGTGTGVYGIGLGGGLVGGAFDFAVVGWRANNANYSGYFNGNHVIANGTKSASVGTEWGNQLLYCTESPEVWFEDLGRAKLINGEVTVELDEIFKQVTFIDEAHPIHVFIQIEGECNDVYVVPGQTSFTVKEKNGGTSNVSFSYRVMAKRIHFQDHKYGNDPVWGEGDTREYMEYSQPPLVDYKENLKLQEEKNKNWKQGPVPFGFTTYEDMLNQSKMTILKKRN